MAKEMNSVDDFLNHRSSDRGGGFLNKWRQPVEKKGGGGKVNVWLHPKRLPIALWQHKFPKIVVRENRKTGEVTTNAWSGSFVCHEDENTLKAQYKRDRETGQRLSPPRRCPLCRMIEAVRQMVDDGKLKWTDKLFRFEGDEDNVVLHAGGLYNAFGRDDLSAEEKKELKEAKIVLGGDRGAWSQNAQAKMNYLFCVVDNANAEGGVQIAIETGLLGDKVKDVIADARESLGEEDGNPFRKPFCIQWEYRKDEQEFGKKYHARRMELMKLTPGVVKALQGPPPDLAEVLAPFNPDSMRAVLERHCLVKNMPWDEIFDVEAPEADGSAEDVAYQDPDGPGDHDEAPPPPKAKAKGKAPPPPPSDSEPEVEADEEDDDGLVECNKCEKGMAEDALECPHCGQHYDKAGNMVAAPPTPPPATRKRGSKVKADDGSEIPF